VHTETSGCVQSSAAPIALEVFGLLMRNQNLQVVKVSLAVVAPRSREDFVDLRKLSLLFAHVVACGKRGEPVCELRERGEFHSEMRM